MPAQIDRDRLPATFGDSGCGPTPLASRLSTAMQEHHGTRSRVSQAVGDDTDTARPVDRERFSCH
ncbi:Uncharacterised protein [Mycobacterium tuberculosis]|nr:Uncharacterised protein [Mycobacterium tuberculosis]